MNTDQRYRQLMALALTGGALLTAGLVWAGPARADGASYINDLHRVGIHDVQGGDAELLQVGQKLCAELRDGATPRQLSALALQRSNSSLGANGLAPEQANALVGFARADLCPGAALAPEEPQWPGPAIP